jgi:DNA modification methylase
MGDTAPDVPTDEGTYSKFFSIDAWAEQNLPFLIVPKPTKKEKEAGLAEFEEETVHDGRKKHIDNAFQRGKTPRKNTNPCVKPIKLMAYLITMASREKDVVLDPFCGSGTTCAAAKLLNRQYIGIEIDPEYHEIAVRRIESVEPIKSTEKAESTDVAAGQETDHGVTEDGDARRMKKVVVLKPPAVKEMKMAA